MAWESIGAMAFMPCEVSLLGDITVSDILIYAKILNLEPFGKSLCSGYTMFFIEDIKYLFTCGESKLS